MKFKIKFEGFNHSALSSQTLAVASAFDFDFLPNNKYTVLPGFCDVHVHFREPGFSYTLTETEGTKNAI